MLIFKKKHVFQGLFLFYFIISGNYLGELLSCKMTEVLTNNMNFKHLVGFISLFLTLSLTVDTTTSLLNLFILSIILYIWFILTTKTTKFITMILISLLVIAFIIHIYKERVEYNIQKNIKKQHNKNILKQINQFDTIIIIIFILLTIIGVIIYIGEKKLDFPKQFNWIEFFIGRPLCDFQRELVDSKGKTFADKLSDNFRYFDLINVAFTPLNKIPELKIKLQQTL